MPAHAAHDACPVRFWKNPTAHSLQLGRPRSSWKWPTAQLSWMPDWQKCPGLQYGAQAVPSPSGLSPAAHSKHPFKLELRKRPRPHTVQMLDATVLHCPASQEEQALAACDLHLPAAHGRQNAIPALD